MYSLQVAPQRRDPILLYIWIDIHIYTHTYIYIYTHTYILIYIYIYIYKYIYICIYMHTLFNTLQHTAAPSKHAATHCTALHRNVLHCIATHCNKPVRCCLVRRRGKRSSQYVQFISAVWHDSFHVCAATHLCVLHLSQYVQSMSAAKHMHESCYTYEWVISHTYHVWMRHYDVTQKRSSQYVQYTRAVWHDSLHVCDATHLWVIRSSQSV